MDTTTQFQLGLNSFGEVASDAGRTELVLGRASAIESFALFRYDIAEYDELFDEKLELFLRLMREDSVTWSGRYRVARANHLSQFDLKYALVNMPVAYRQRTIRLFGEEVAPRVRQLLATEPADPWRFEDRPVVEITPGHKAVHA